MVYNNLRNIIKIYVKIKLNEDNEITIAKTSSIISQFGIEDALLIDEYLQYFFFQEQKIFFFLNSLNLNEFYVPIILNINRDDIETEITIIPLLKNFLLKLFLDKKISFFKFNLFLINFLSLKSHIFYIDFLKTLPTSYGLLLTFKNRDFFKARKINFRRKIKKNLFLEDS